MSTGKQNCYVNMYHYLNMCFKKEIGFVIHNSHFVNAFLCELSDMVPHYEGSQYLDLGTAYVS